MKTKDYYDDMRSVTGCINWIEAVGLRYVRSKHDYETVLPGDKDESNLSFYYDDNTDDLDFINCINRLRRWKESSNEANEIN